MGKLVEQSIKTMYQGVSRQPDPVRLRVRLKKLTTSLYLLSPVVSKADRRLDILQRFQVLMIQTHRQSMRTLEMLLNVT